MAKINKLALASMALRYTLNELDTRELLAVLSDLYASGAAAELPRWYGNGNGTNGLEQGFYNHMTTFRRVSNLWGKIILLTEGDKEQIKQETYKVRDLIVKKLHDRGVDLTEIGGEAPVNE